MNYTEFDRPYVHICYVELFLSACNISHDY